MSQKNMLKRIALVAVSALGLGLISIVPASAAPTKVSSLQITATADPAGTYVTVAQSGSVFTVMTRNTTVALADLTLTVGSNATDGQLVIAAGSSTGTNTNAMESNEAGAIAESTSAALNSSGLLDTNIGSGIASLAAGTTYRLWDDQNVTGAAANSLTLADEEYIEIVVVQTTANHVPVTLDTATTTLAGRTNQQVSITLTGDLTSTDASTSTYPFTRIAASITGRPSGAVATGSLAQLTLAGNTSAANFTFGDTGTTLTAGSTAIASMGSDTGSSSTVATLNYHALGNTAVTSNIANQTVGTLTFTPTAAGTYTISVWNESSSTGTASLSGSESYQTFTINVSSGVSSVTLSPVNTSSVKSGVNGSLIKVSLKDSAGNAAILAPGETVTLTPSGTGDIASVNGIAVTSEPGAAYNLASTAFNTSGVAWINMIDATAGTTNLTASINGANTVSTAITYRAISAVAAGVPVPVNTTGWVTSSGDDINVPIGTSSITWSRAASTGSVVGFTVGERLVGGVGAITGYTYALGYDAAASGSTTLGYASLTVTATTAATGLTAYVIASDNTTAGAAAAINAANASSLDAAGEAEVASLTNRAGAFSVTPSIINSVVGASNTIGATLLDVFGRAYPYQTVSVTVAGKNPVTTARTAVTDADGKVSFTFTDANTTTAVNDVVTFAVTSGSSTTATIAYGTNTVSTVTMEYPGDADVVAGTTSTDVPAGSSGATGSTTGALTSAAEVSAVVTGSTGALLAGVPVTFAVSGLTGAEVDTRYVTVYTDTTGYATTYIYSYAAGKATVTATAGGVSSTADIYFKQKTATEARTIAATVSGGTVTATVKDRYGNVIEGVTVNATRTGTGYFGSGASTATGTTDKNGVVEFLFTGTGTVTVAFSAADYGQSADASGKVGATAVTAAAAGTATTAQKGLGAALAPAGVNSASVSVASTDAAAAAAEAAADAAAEAIDAANAATDAANLAAEAADAATVAAEEARDAADAATAAVEELATQVATLMAALKAQITTLANTVAKIAKKVKA